MPKSGTGRAVDLFRHVADRMARLRVTRATAALRQGRDLRAWIFCTRTGQPFHTWVIQRAFGRCSRPLSLARVQRRVERLVVRRGRGTFAMFSGEPDVVFRVKLECQDCSQK